MRGRGRWIVASFSVAVALGAVSDTAVAAECRYLPDERRVEVKDSAYGSTGEHYLSQGLTGTIGLRNNRCTSAGKVDATVLNTDTITITDPTLTSGEFWIQAKRGDFEPGATPETDGRSEIEFDVALGSEAAATDTLVLDFTAERGEVQLDGGSLAGLGAFDLYPDRLTPDADVTSPDIERVEVRLPYNAWEDDIVDLTGPSLAFTGPLGIPTEIDTGFGSGADRVYGGSGPDSVIWASYVDGNLGDDLIERGTVDYSTPPVGSILGVDVTLTTDPSKDLRTNEGSAVGPEGRDELIDVSGVIGSPFADTIQGHFGSDQLRGGEGGDEISGEPGRDLLDGGPGGDTITGGDGDDTIEGRTGDDELTGGGGRDTVAGASGNDRIDLADGDWDYVDCGPGRDFVRVDIKDGVKRCETIERAGTVTSSPDGRSYSGRPSEETWVTDGSISTAALGSESTFIGGSFDYVGPRTGHFALLDETTGKVDPVMPDLDGPVNDIEPDGEGGWFVGGGFQHVDGVLHPAMVHLDAEGRVDPELPALTGEVNSIAFDADREILYLGGSYIGPMGDRNLMAISTADNRVIQKFAPIIEDTTVREVALAPDGKFVYAARDGSQNFDKLGEYRASDGVRTDWAPDVTYRISAILVTEERVFIGGGFRLYSAGQAGTSEVPRINLAAIRRSDGAVTDWNPIAQMTGPSLSVIDMEFSPDGRSIYAGGVSGDGTPGENRYAAEFAVDDGAITEWNPDVGGTIHDLEVDPGTGDVYIAGGYGGSETLQRRYLARVDGDDADLQSWSPLLSDRAMAVALQDGTVAVGGDFSSINGVLRDGLAEIGPDGTVTDFESDAPPTSSEGTSVTALALSPDEGTIYVGSDSRSFAERSVTGLSTGDGAVTLPRVAVSGSAVNDLVVSPNGERLYVGGSFRRLAGVTAQSLGALSLPGGQLEWTTPVSSIASMDLDGGSLFVGGVFTTFGGVSRTNLAALDPDTRQVLPWNPGAPYVNDLDVAPDGLSVFVAGGAGTVGGLPRQGVAQVDSLVGLATPWSPAIVGPVKHVVAGPGGGAVIGGRFTRVGGAELENVAEIDPAGLPVTNWQPMPGSGFYNVEPQAGRDGSLLVTGDFDTAGDRSIQNLAEFPPADSGSPSEPSSTTYEIPQDDPVDVSPPALRILSEFDRPLTHPFPNIQFEAEQSAILECSFDGAAPEPCGPSSAYIPSDFEDGDHRFTIRATDEAGNSALAEKAFTLDTTPPALSLLSGPSGRTREKRPTFTFEAEAGGLLRCSISITYESDAYAPCSGNGEHTPPADLPDGSYKFQISLRDAAGNSSWVERRFTVDTHTPDVAVTDGPTGPTSESRPTFRFSTNLATRVECSIDSASAFRPCAGESSDTPWSALADGSHTFRVRAIGDNGSSAVAQRPFTVDTVAPTVSVTGGPTGATTNRRPQFTFSESDVSVRCSLESAEFNPCSGYLRHSPSSDLPDGAYVFRVRATDPAGNATIAERTFRVDTTAPATTITTGPSGLTNDAQPTFGFSSEADVTLRCYFDSATPGPCATASTHSPASRLGEGSHVLSVRATDSVGNSSVAVRAFAVDTVAPWVSITSGPTGPTADATPSFGFSYESGAKAFCAFVSGGLAPCSTDFTHDPESRLPDGANGFRVTVSDEAGNSASALRQFFIDTTAPDSRIESGPESGTARSATFVFSAPGEGGDATFECRLDDSGYGSCESPARVTRLSVGEHAFRVRATDGLGNVEDSPAMWRFSVTREEDGPAAEDDEDTPAAEDDEDAPVFTPVSPEARMPETRVTSFRSRRAAARKRGSARFEFDSDTAGATFECRLGSRPWNACASPKAYKRLRVGSYWFEVRAIDLLGNRDPTPAWRQFTVRRAQHRVPR